MATDKPDREAVNEPESVERWLERISLAVADGRDPDSDPLPEGDDDQAQATADQLKRLSRLRELFRLRAASVADRLPECPFRWSRLDVIELVGQGSFAHVFRARDPVLDREVALKLFRDSSADPSELLAEARRHARVRHPRVLAIHGADIDAGVAGLWTDLLQGGTLETRLETDGTVAPPLLARLAGDLAAGLVAVHEQGMIHGDLKPANVWIDEAGRALLMDFGASVQASEASPARYGSPVSMAPELFEGSAPSAASDAWALGAVLYRAATGCYPLKGNSYTELRDAHQVGAAPAFVPLRRRARPFARLIEALLHAEPVQKPSPQQVLAELSRIERAPARRLRRAALAAIILSLAAGLTVSLWLLDRAESARRSAERARFEAQTSKDFLIESVRRMSPESEQGLGTVRAVLDFLAEFGEKELVETPLALGELEAVVGTRLTHFEALEEGLGLARRGVERIETTDADAHHELARAYNLLANAERQAGRYEAAREDGERALAQLAALPRTEQVRYQMVQIRGMLVGLLGDTGRWNEALAAQREQLAEREALVGADDPRMAVEYNNLADPLWRVGQLDEALDAYRRSLTMLRAGQPRRPYPEALVTEGMAWVQMLQGRFDDARASLASARAIYGEIGMAEGSAAMRSLAVKEAGILRRTGDPKGAARRLKALFDGDEPGDPQQRESLLALGVACLEADCPADALLAFRQAQAMGLPEGHPEVDYLAAAVATAAQVAGEGSPAQARDALDRAIARFRDAGYERSERVVDMQRWRALVTAAGHPIPPEQSAKPD